MPFLPTERVLERIRTDSANSSHFIWLLAKDMRFFECRNRWVFGFKQQSGVTLLALEPLTPVGTEINERELADSLAELEAALPAGTRAFVSIYQPFFKLLSALGYQGLQVGQEPWVELEHCIPKGNAGKGVRSARNQALRSGLRVEEWTADEIERDPAKRATLEEIHAEWRSSRLVHLGGFLNATDPTAYLRERRYFILRSPARAEAFLVASPVAKLNGHFLEDLVIRPSAPRGAGELLTLEAMVGLQQSGGAVASLGVVSTTTVDARAASKLPPLAHLLLVRLPAVLARFYNFEGMEIYRKRFKPHAWQAIHLAVKPAPDETASRAWLRTLWAILLAFRPQFQVSAGWLARALLRPLRRYPIAIGIGAISLALFAAINRFGQLPEWALMRYGFFGNAQFWQWPYRSVVSDFLYFDVSHFVIWATALVLAVAWAERSHRASFLLPFLALTSFFDDFINYAVITLPFHFFQPHIFHTLVAEKDVGGSLILVTVVGMQICQFRRLREPLFAIVTISMVLGFAFTSAQIHFLVMNLNHALFFVLGFLIGKLKFEHERALSRKAAKGRPPVARCVVPPGPEPERKRAAA